MRLLTLMVATLAIGCTGKVDKDYTIKDDTGDTDTDIPVDDTGTADTDADGDGYAASEDCDDGDASIHPGADDVWYDGIDSDCAGNDDFDQDGDGYESADGNPEVADCDDTNDHISPGAEEICNGIDDNCDGGVDDGSDAYYLDADGDGFGTGDPVGFGCDPDGGPPAGTSYYSTDCDDTQTVVNPDAPEICDGLDNNCDGVTDDDAIDKGTVYTDADGDGYGDSATATEACGTPDGTVADGSDCDDTDAVTYPGATEICDVKDNNCDGAIDEGAAADRTYYADLDGDGYGDPAAALDSCGAPAGYVEQGTDCNDADMTVSPGATELCDGIDNDCNGTVDDAVSDGIVQYADADGDGYGGGEATQACELMAGYSADGTDCDDADAATSPAATEMCDGIDNNCDTQIDEGTAADAPTWYLDVDGDGYGDPAGGAPSCDQPTGFAAASDDCNDADSAINPGAAEVCDGVDNDCNGAVDDSASAGTYYADADGDGYGDATLATDACEAPAGYVADATDCDDTAVGTNPGATETCDGVDNDCDGSVDDAPSDGIILHADVDGDGYGDALTRALGCSEGGGWILDASDCDDSASSVFPGATETCDGTDNNCDGTVDEDSAVDVITWYDDADGDGYADGASGGASCTVPTGATLVTGDCDDGSAAVNPAATETCNGIDDDCDGSIDGAGATGGTSWYADADSDGYGDAGTTTSACSAPAGYVASAGDCNDAVATIHPGASETCNSLDDDCDGTVDDGATGAATWYADADGDGYGDASSTTTSCSMPGGYVASGTDCDDADSAVNPGATEVGNGIDDDCDGSIDEDLTPAIAEGDIIFTEIDRQPRVGGTSTNTNAQWFEIYNTTDNDIDLSDWYIRRVSSSLGEDGFYVDPSAGLTIAAHDYAVFCKTDNFAAVSTSYSTMVCDYYWGSETHSATSSSTYWDNTYNIQRDEDSMAIYYGGNSSTGTQIDSVHWYYDATNGYWPRDAARSMQLDPSFYDSESNDSVDAWCSTTANVYFQWYYVSSSVREFGTPGRAGHACP